jgi:hypothetical protein
MQAILPQFYPIRHLYIEPRETNRALAQLIVPAFRRFFAKVTIVKGSYELFLTSSVSIGLF